MFYSKEALESIDAEVKAKMTPEQLAMSREVDRAVAIEGEALLDRMQKENEIRAWVSWLIGGSVELTVSQIEEICDTAKKTPIGKPFNFTYKAPGMTKDGTDVVLVSVALVKTATGKLDRVDRYIHTLESTIIDLTNNSQFTPLGFFDLIKLAFKRLFKRSK